MPAVTTRGRGRRTISEINMVPFIDVMLVLLIIFMVTAPLIAPSSIDLPSVGKASKTPDEVIQIIVGKDESLKLKTASAGENTAQVAIKDIATRVRAAQAGKSVAVVISADKSVKYEVVVKVMDSLQRAGVQRIGLSVQTVP
jgi:biopolymer transport protein TolR